MKNYGKQLTAILSAAILAIALGGCAGPATTTRGPETRPSPAILSGKVVETMDAGGYTYVCLEKDGKKTWVAAPAMKVVVGDELQMLPGQEMPNFTSSTLNRTFDSIIFSGGPVRGGTAPANTSPPAKEEPLQPPVLAGKVVEVLDAGRYTYINIEKDGKHGWSAVPHTPVKVGDEIEVLPGTEMGRFTSNFLHRTFENIYFSAGVKGVDPTVPNQPAPNQPATSSPTMPLGHPSLSGNAPPHAPAEMQQAASGTVLSGKVVETMDAGGYTYVCLDKEGKKTWAAVPTTKIKVGDEIELAPGPEMKQFSSKTLNRTFESIIFSSGLVTKK